MDQSAGSVFQPDAWRGLSDLPDSRDSNRKLRGILYLLLFNPTTTFVMTMTRLTGREQLGGGIVRWFGNHGESIVSRNGSDAVL